MSTTPPVPAGWYPDPAGSGRPRWWDGTAWTEHYQGALVAQPVAPAPYAAQPELRAPEGTKAYTVWAWLVALLPLVSLLGLFSISPETIITIATTPDPAEAARAQVALLTSPGYLLSVLLGWVTTAAIIVFGWLDWRALRKAGVPRPFHWAWGFFQIGGYPVYAIGRAIVTKRRTGHGSGILWATIGVIVFTFVLAITWTVVITGTAFEAIATQQGVFAP